MSAKIFNHYDPDTKDGTNNEAIDLTVYAETDMAAMAKYNVFGNHDPYPTIMPALLNSADIAAYVKATALIYPFYEEKLKGASYDVTIKGRVVYWKYTESGTIETRKTDLLNKGDCFDLEPNSIAFVTLEPMFRIPTYLALRFNLKITHIYKGLLLGTGPLVDPGFCGQLSIPLHNLTSNTYRFFYGEELISMEFTKMSPNTAWLPNSYPLQTPHNEKYIEDVITSDRTVEDYITKAIRKDRLNYVISSIPDAVNDCKNEVRSANKAVSSVKREARIQAVVSVVAVCSLVISAVGFSLNAINKANDRYDALNSEYAEMKLTLESEISQLQEDIQQLTVSLENLQVNRGMD